MVTGQSAVGEGGKQRTEGEGRIRTICQTAPDTDTHTHTHTNWLSSTCSRTRGGGRERQRVALARAETLAATLRTTRDGTCHALLLWSEVDGGGEVERACDLSGRHGCLLVEAPRHAPAGTAVRVELRVAPPRAGEPRDAARGCRVEWEGGVVWEEAMEHDHDGDSLRLAASARGGAEGVARAQHHPLPAQRVAGRTRGRETRRRSRSPSRARRRRCRRAAARAAAWRHSPRKNR